MMFAEELIKEKNPAVIRIGKYLEERAKSDRNRFVAGHDEGTL